MSRSPGGLDAVLKFRERHGELKVAEELVEAPIALDGVDVFPEGSTDFAADGIQVLQDPFQAAVKVDPLGCGLGADAGNARKVVGGLPYQRGEIGVAGRGNEVLFFDGCRVHARNIGNALFRVQDEHVVRDELESVTVP